MIIKRKYYSSNDTVTLYHVTKKENVSSILREGLKCSKATESHDTFSMQTGIPEKFLKNKLYLLRDLILIGGRLPFKSSYRKLLKIEIPVSVFKTYKDVGDPIRSYFKNKYEWAEYYVQYTKENRPEAYKKYGKSVLYNSALLGWDNVSPRKIMVVEKDIPAKYISIL